MTSEVFFTRHHHYHGHRGGAAPHVQRSVGSSRSGAALTFPPLYLDPADSLPETAPNDGLQQPPTFALGSTFYHHPELHALVSGHLTDSSANTGTGTTFLGPRFGGHGPDDEDGEDADDMAAYADMAVPQPRISQEDIALNEDLVPAPLDLHGDMLPAEQHPSYPFGNLFGPLSGMITADSAIMGGPHVLGSAAANQGTGLSNSIAALGLDFGGGLAAFTNVGQPSHGKRGAVSSSWNQYTNKASRSKLVGSAGAPNEWGPSPDDEPASHNAHTKHGHRQGELIRAARKMGLSPNLVFRSCTSAVLAPPTWPFRRYGPGSTSYSALLRPSSNIYGAAPASQALAATLGGLPASAKIIKEIWSDLALEELVPLHIGSTSATRLLSHGLDESDTEDSAGDTAKSGKKRARTSPEADDIFAKRMAIMEPDPLDLLGPISREIRGQAARPWGTVTQPRRSPSTRPRHRSDYPTRTEDEAAEAEHDDPDQGYQHHDRLRYTFSLPPAAYSWTEEHDEGEDEDASPITHTEPDGIGWSTAKRIYVNEQRDQVLPQLASRGDSGQVSAYQVRGLRANQGLLPRPEWSWADGPPDENVGDASHADMSQLSLPHHDDADCREANGEELEAEAEEGQDDEWQSDEAELQHALLQQYGETADEEHLSEDEESVEHYDEDDDDVQEYTDVEEEET